MLRCRKRFDLLTCRTLDDRQSSPLPDFVPNTHPDEPTIPPDYGMNPQPNQKRTRASSRRAPSATPDLAMDIEQPSDSAPAESSRPLRKVYADPQSFEIAAPSDNIPCSSPREPPRQQWPCSALTMISPCWIPVLQRSPSRPRALSLSQLQL